MSIISSPFLDFFRHCDSQTFQMQKLSQLGVLFFLGYQWTSWRSSDIKGQTQQLVMSVSVHCASSILHPMDKLVESDVTSPAFSHLFWMISNQPKNTGNIYIYEKYENNIKISLYVYIYNIYIYQGLLNESIQIIIPGTMVFTRPGKNGIEMVVLGVRQYLACYDFILLFNVSYWGVYDHFYGCLVYDFKCQSIIGHTSTVIICVCFATYFYTLYISLLLVQAILSRLWTCMPPASREFLPSTSKFCCSLSTPTTG